MYKCLSPGAIGVRATLPESVAMARTHGFGGVDISIGEVEKMAAEQSVDAVRALFAGAGVLPGGWGLPVDWRGEESKYNEGLAGLGRLAALGHSIGAPRVTMWLMPCSDDLPFDENFRFHVERFTPIARILKENGCRLGLEFIGPKTLRASKKHEFIYTMGGMLELCAAIGDNVGLLLDAWHWYTSGGTLDDLAKLTNQQVVYVHINDAPAGVPIDQQVDNVRCLPGETGVIDLKGFLKSLAAIGYDGPVTPEPFSQKLREMDAEGALRTTAETLDNVWRAAGIA